MNIYRYTVVATGEVFDGTREEAAKHFKRKTGTLKAQEHKGILKRELINGRQKRVTLVDVYRFEYQGEAFEGTVKEAVEFYGLTLDHFRRLVKDNKINKVLARKVRTEKVYEKEVTSPPHVKRLLTKELLLRDWIVNGAGGN